MVLFSRAAAPAAQESPTKKTAGCQPPHSAEDLIIPPPFERYCLMGFAAQVVLDVCTVVVIFCLKGAFL